MSPLAWLVPVVVDCPKTSRAPESAGLAPISHGLSSRLSMRDSGGSLAVDASARRAYAQWATAKPRRCANTPGPDKEVLAPCRIHPSRGTA